MMSKKKYNPDYGFLAEYDTDMEEAELESLFRQKKIRGQYRTDTIKAGDQLALNIYPAFAAWDFVQRKKKMQETREAQKAVNQKHAKRKLQMLCAENFGENDFWMTLTFRDEDKPETYEDAKRMWRNYLIRIRRERKKQGLPPLKYIAVLEMGTERPHFHCIVSGDIGDIVNWFVEMRNKGFQIAMVGHDRKFAGEEYFPAMQKAGFRIEDNPDKYYLWKGRGITVSLREIANNLKQAAETEKGFMSSRWKPSLIVKVDAITQQFAYNHNHDLVLGRTSAGTLTLEDRELGLWGSIKINPKDSQAMDAYERIKRGDITGCSFGFDIEKESTEVKDDGSVHWTIEKVNPLLEVSPCVFPAYEATSIAARERDLEEIKQRQTEAWRIKMKERLHHGMPTKYQFGVDVAKWQGLINWGEVKTSGYGDFAVLKCTKKNNQIEESFARNYSGCKAAGIPIAVYRYVYAKSVGQAVEEANGVLAVLKSRQIEGEIWLDMEEASIKPIGKAALSVIINTEADIFKAHGYKVGIYCNRDWYDHVLDSATLSQAYKFWIATYGKNTGNASWQNRSDDPKDIAVAWQYTSKGSVPGINGDVDLDLLY